MIDLEKDIQYVKGIGPKKAYKLNKLGIFTLKDLLFYFPRQFEDRSNLKKIAQLQNESSPLASSTTSTPNILPRAISSCHSVRELRYCCTSPAAKHDNSCGT